MGSSGSEGKDVGLPFALFIKYGPANGSRNGTDEEMQWPGEERIVVQDSIRQLADGARLEVGMPSMGT